MKIINVSDEHALKKRYQQLDDKIKKDVEALLNLMKSHIAQIEYNNHQTTQLLNIHNLFFLSDLAEKFTESGEKIGDFIAVEYDFNHHLHDTAHHVAEQLHGISIGLSVINFLKTPSEYLYAWFKGKQVEEQASKNARWAQAGLLLTAAITAFLMPSIAPAIGLGAAFISIGGAIVSLANLHYSKLELKQSITNLDELIMQAQKTKEALILDSEKELNAFYLALQQENSSLLKKHSEACETLSRALAQQTKHLMELQEQKTALETKLAKKGTMAIVDRSLGIILPAIVIVGIMAILMSSSLIGVGLVTAATVIGLTYMLGRLLTPSVSKFFSWCKTKLFPSSIEANEGNTLHPEPTLDVEQDMNLLSDKTTNQTTSHTLTSEMNEPQCPQSFDHGLGLMLIKSSKRFDLLEKKDEHPEVKRHQSHEPITSTLKKGDEVEDDPNAHKITEHLTRDDLHL